MHWDGAISIGNILTLVAMLTAMAVGFTQFVKRHSEAVMTLTTALNNLSHITDGLEKAVQIQNGRLAKVEMQIAVDQEVERRMKTQRER
jgi:hypothetical protein